MLEWKDPLFRREFLPQGSIAKGDGALVFFVFSVGPSHSTFNSKNKFINV